MKSSNLMGLFDERLSEVMSYIELLSEIEEAAQSGPPRLEGSHSIISVEQQKILYSSVYLQLYNLVEAVVSQCIEALADAASDPSSHWRPGDLNTALRNEWIRANARTHIDMSPQHRLELAIATCVHLIDQLPIDRFTIEVGKGGNWDDDNIENVSKRLGCELAIDPKVLTAARYQRRDDMGAFKLVKNRRNRLAHGSISFVECADGVLVAELSEIVDAVGDYLREAITSFVSYIDSGMFLRSDPEPADIGS
jgi:hypothetical protein